MSRIIFSSENTRRNCTVLASIESRKKTRKGRCVCDVGKMKLDDDEVTWEPISRTLDVLALFKKELRRLRLPWIKT